MRTNELVRQHRRLPAFESVQIMTSDGGPAAEVKLGDGAHPGKTGRRDGVTRRTRVHITNLFYGAVTVRSRHRRTMRPSAVRTVSSTA